MADYAHYKKYFLPILTQNQKFLAKKIDGYLKLSPVKTYYFHVPTEEADVEVGLIPLESIKNPNQYKEPQFYHIGNGIMMTMSHKPEQNFVIRLLIVLKSEKVFQKIEEDERMKEYGSTSERSFEIADVIDITDTSVAEKTAEIIEISMEEVSTDDAEIIEISMNGTDIINKTIRIY